VCQIVAEYYEDPDKIMNIVYKDLGIEPEVEEEEEEVPIEDKEGEGIEEEEDSYGEEIDEEELETSMAFGENG
jgi:hypothetical protein